MLCSNPSWNTGYPDKFSWPSPGKCRESVQLGYCHRVFWYMGPATSFLRKEPWNWRPSRPQYVLIFHFFFCLVGCKPLAYMATFPLSILRAESNSAIAWFLAKKWYPCISVHVTHNETLVQEQCLCKVETEQIGASGSLRTCIWEMPGSIVVPD